MIHITAVSQAGSQINNCIKQSIAACGLIDGRPEHELPSERLVPVLTCREFRDFKFDVDVDGNYVGDVDITFDFNGVQVTVKADSDPELIFRDWNRAMSGYIEKAVGPYPNPALTNEEKETDDRIEAANEQRRQQRQSEYDAKANAHRQHVEARMAEAPEMEFSNKARWDEVTPQIAESIYGTSIASYAERWARLMQLELSEGKELADIWNETSHEADLEGMSGYSASIATHLLTETWVHGAELRKLHNAFWGSSETEGTVNPAIITINKSEPAESSLNGS